MVNNSSYDDSRQKTGLFTFAPSKPVTITLGIIMAILFIAAIVMYKTNHLNLVSFGALAVGVIMIIFDLFDKLGMVRMKRDCKLYRAEIVASVQYGSPESETYQNLLDYGVSKPATIYTSEQHLTGEFIDVYINPKTGETMDKFFFENRVHSSKKSSVLIAGIVLVILAAVVEILIRIIDMPMLEIIIAGILVVVLLLYAAVWHLGSYIKMKRGMGAAVFVAEGMITDYRKLESINFEGIPVYEYYPTIKYWDDGEKTYYSTTAYSQKKYPAGSSIDLYVDEDGKFFETKSMKKMLSWGIICAVGGVLLALGIYLCFIAR